ncbi:MAG TPA: hypothetical protein VE981_01470 [Planctomycetota bacterium]|nr:hypothetical protein [Planctomycetota bacterium]
MNIMLSLAAAMLLGSLQERDNPAFKYWSEWKVGAWAKHKTIAGTEEQKIEIETTITLIEITSDKAVVESTGKTTVAGREKPTAARKQEFKLRDPKLGTIDKEGDETIEVGGKSYPCHWILTSTESAAGRVTMKIWCSKDVPGGLVQSEVGSEGAPTTKTQLIDFGSK